MLRLPKLPLSMTAVAVVTPSSGSNSAAVLLLWVVGADTCPSLVVAGGPRDRPALSSLWRSTPTCSGATGLRSKLPGTPIPSGGAMPGSHYRGPDRLRTTAGRRVLARRGAHEQGGRP